MKPFFACIFFLAQFVAMAQQSVVYGVVSIFNSQTEKGERKYISRAEVKDVFKAANTTVTDASGKFKLVFVGVSDGYTVSFNVEKNGWEVVNINALTAIGGQKDSVRISMAPPGKIAAYRKLIYKIGLEEAEKQQKYLLAKANRELTELRKNSVANEKRIKQLENDLLSIEEKRKKIDGQAMELAIRYAPVNLDDASSLFRDAFNLLKKGNLDSSLFVLTKVNLANKVFEILEERKKLEILQADLYKRDSAQKQMTVDIGEALQFKTDLHKTRNEYDSAAYCFELLLQLDSSNIDYVFNYAVFLQWLNQYDKALSYYLRVIDSCNQRLITNDQVYKPYLAKIYNKLGNLYFEKNDFTNSELTYKKALQIRQEFAHAYPQIYEPDLAQTLNNLGNFYLEKNEFENAKAAYYSSVEIRQRLAKNDEESAMAALGQTLNNLGNLYYRQNEFTRADSAYKASLEIRRHLAKRHDRQLYEPDVAGTQNNLGVLHFKQNDLNGAMSAFRESYNIYKKIAEDNPNTYLPLLAIIQNNLGNLYTMKNDFRKAEEAYEESLDIRTYLVNNNPERFLPELANSYFNLGMFYTKKNDYEKASRNYERSYGIRKELIIHDTDVYAKDFSVTGINLAKIYIQLKEYKKAEDTLVELLSIQEKLINDSLQTFIKEASLTSVLLLKVYGSRLTTSVAEADKLNFLEKQKALENKLAAWSAKDSFAAKNYAAYYGSVAKYMLNALKFKEAEQYAQKAFGIDTSSYDIKAILAPAMLFLDKYDEALKIYEKLKTLKDPSGKPYTEICLKDLDTLEAKGAVNNNTSKIRAFLKAQ